MEDLEEPFGSARERMLIVAAQRGQAALVRLVLANGASPALTDRAGLTALHWAARRGGAECVAELLGAGAPVDARDRAGRTPLFDAVGAGADPHVLGLLLEAGADPELTDADGVRALMRAERSQAVALLLDRGAALEAADPRGRTALMHAVLRRDADVARALLCAGADPRRPDRDGRTPLDLAGGDPALQALLASPPTSP